MDGILISEGYSVDDIDLENMIDNDSQEVKKTKQNSNKKFTGPEIKLSIDKKTLTASLKTITVIHSTNTLHVTAYIQSKKNYTKALGLCMPVKGIKKYILSMDDEDLMNGQPLILERATLKHIEREIFKLQSYFVFNEYI